MFKKIDGPVLVWRPVTISVPTDGDNFKKWKMRLQLQIEDKEVIDQRQADMDAGDPNTDWLLTVIKDWKDYCENDGTTPVAFNDDELKAFLAKSYVRVAVITEYFNAANGGLGRRK